MKLHGFSRWTHPITWSAFFFAKPYADHMGRELETATHKGSKALNRFASGPEAKLV
jgi:hypothetical protein